METITKHHETSIKKKGKWYLDHDVCLGGGILFLIIIIISVVIHNVENDLEYRKAVELANKCPEKVEGKNGKEK